MHCWFHWKQLLKKKASFCRSLQSLLYLRTGEAWAYPWYSPPMVTPCSSRLHGQHWLRMLGWFCYWKPNTSFSTLQSSTFWVQSREVLACLIPSEINAFQMLNCKLKCHWFQEQLFPPLDFCLWQADWLFLASWTFVLLKSNHLLLAHLTSGPVWVLWQPTWQMTFVQVYTWPTMPSLSDRCLLQHRMHFSLLVQASSVTLIGCASFSITHLHLGKTDRLLWN